MDWLLLWQYKVDGLTRRSYHHTYAYSTDYARSYNSSTFNNIRPLDRSLMSLVRMKKKKKKGPADEVTSGQWSLVCSYGWNHI